MLRATSEGGVAQTPERRRGILPVVSRTREQHGWTQEPLDDGRTRHTAKVGPYALVVTTALDGRATWSVSGEGPLPAAITKGDEEIAYDVPSCGHRHNFTAYVCCACFGRIMGPVAVRWCEGDST